MKPFQTAGRVCKWTRGCLAAAYVRCLEAFGALQQIELDGFALVESAIAVFLDGGEVDENIFTRGPLDKTVSFCPVEPLYCTLLSHKSTPFPSVDRFTRVLREACASKSPLKELRQFASGHVLLPRGLPQKKEGPEPCGRKL